MYSAITALQGFYGTPIAAAAYVECDSPVPKGMVDVAAAEGALDSERDCEQSEWIAVLKGSVRRMGQ